MKRALIIGKDRLYNDINSILPLTGYQASAKNQNGIEALRIVQRLEPDLVICGSEIAGISALDLLENLVHSKICPIIFVLDERDYAHLDHAVKTEVHIILTAPLRAADVLAGIIQAEYRYNKEMQNIKALNKLNDELKTRKKVYQALLILVAKGMDEEKAYSLIRSEAMESRKTIRAVAENIITGKWQPLC